MCNITAWQTLRCMRKYVHKDSPGMVKNLMQVKLIRSPVAESGENGGHVECKCLAELKFAPET